MHTRQSLTIQSVTLLYSKPHTEIQHHIHLSNHTQPSSPTINIPHHPPHNPPNTPHRLASIPRLKKIKPFRPLHLQTPPFLRRRVETLLRGAMGDEIEVAVIDADADDGDVVVERGDEVDLKNCLLLSSRR